MKITQFKDEAHRRQVTIDAVRQAFEADLGKGKTLGVISPDKTEIICFEQNEIEELTAELSSGKVDLTNLTQQLNLSDYQLHIVLQYLLKTGRIDGELTYNTFVTRSATKKLLLQKSKARKRDHRREMTRKRR